MHHHTDRTVHTNCRALTGTRNNEWTKMIINSSDDPPCHLQTPLSHVLLLKQIKILWSDSKILAIASRYWVLILVAATKHVFKGLLDRQGHYTHFCFINKLLTQCPSPKGLKMSPGRHAWTWSEYKLENKNKLKTHQTFQLKLNFDYKISERR